MFQDEAGFGRISNAAACWVPEGVRAIVPSQHVREYNYIYGAVDPRDGERFFITAPTCNSMWMSAFLEELSSAYPNDLIILIMDNASWHSSEELKVPNNIECLFIPPYTPEMNPIEQIWKELRKDFANQIFKSLKAVMDQLEVSVNNLTDEAVMSITGRSWILNIF
jgi:transposase